MKSSYHVRYQDGRETTVATKHLAPKGEVMSQLPLSAKPTEESERCPSGSPSFVEIHEDVAQTPPAVSEGPVEQPPLRRSERVRRPVDKLNL